MIVLLQIVFLPFSFNSFHIKVCIKRQRIYDPINSQKGQAILSLANKCFIVYLDRH